MQLALPRTMTALKGGFRLPSVIPPFNKRTYWVFSALWFLALMLAVAGPIAGFYFRSTEPANNSQLLIGSRAGFAVAPRDSTLVRFTVGPASRASGNSCLAIISWRSTVCLCRQRCRSMRQRSRRTPMIPPISRWATCYLAATTPRSR